MPLLKRMIVAKSFQVKGLDEHQIPWAKTLSPLRIRKTMSSCSRSSMTKHINRATTNGSLGRFPISQPTTFAKLASHLGAPFEILQLHSKVSSHPPHPPQCSFFFCSPFCIYIFKKQQKNKQKYPQTSKIPCFLLLCALRFRKIRCSFHSKVSIKSKAACLALAERPAVLIEPLTSMTMTTSLGPVEPEEYLGPVRFSRYLGTWDVFYIVVYICCTYL